VSLAINDEHGVQQNTWTYTNGYLQKSTRMSNNTYTETYVWENGNIKTLAWEDKYPGSSYSGIITYEYGTTQNKPCSIDLSLLIIGANGESPRGFYGKPCVYMPSKETESGSYTTYRYQTDNGGYITNIFKSENGGSEYLWCIIKTIAVC
jgi:hypothetical protein